MLEKRIVIFFNEIIPRIVHLVIHSFWDAQRRAVVRDALTEERNRIMKKDLYVKVCLTVIAVSLSTIA